MPALIPGYAELDPSTNLHITGKFQIIDPDTYRLVVDGKVKKRLEYSLEQLRCLPRVSAGTLLVCPGYFEDYAAWAGVSLKFILDQAELQPGAKEIILMGKDGYMSFVSLEEAMKETNFLAYEWEGEPLPVLHGFPLRAVFPSLPGNKWVKWLVQVRVD
mgnify:CR=1 FL=1